jgi:hypothetical protein
MEFGSLARAPPAAGVVEEHRRVAVDHQFVELAVGQFVRVAAEQVAVPE